MINSPTRTLSFDKIDDLTLAGESFIDYNIIVTGTSGKVVPVSGSATFTLRVKNPCIDSDFVSFKVLDAILLTPYVEYDLFTTGKSWVHNLWPLVTKPFDHTLCGPIAYEATMDG